MPANLTSQRNSDLMEKIGISDLYRKFSHDLVERLHPGDSLLYYITSIPSYSSLDLFPLRNRKESTIRGILFVFFISLIIRSALLRGMESSGLLKKYSLERMILELEKIHVMEDQNGNLKELERTTGREPRARKETSRMLICMPRSTLAQRNISRKMLMIRTQPHVVPKICRYY